MNREAGNGLPEKVGIGWRERERKEIEEWVFGGSSFGVLRGKHCFFFIRRVAGGQATAKKKKGRTERDCDLGERRLQRGKKK